MEISQAKSNTLPVSIGLVAALAVVGLLPLDPSLRFTLVVAMGWAVAAVGLDLFVGYAGQLSFGQAGFVALGAYAITALRVHAGMPVVIAVILSVAITATVALVIGTAMVRLQVFGVAIVTFFFAFLVYTVLYGSTLSGVTGGAAGLAVPTLEIGGINFARGGGLYALAVGVLAVAVVLTSNLSDSRSGRALRLIKSNEDVAAASGVQVSTAKILAFVYCCVLGALGGFIYSLSVGYLSPDSFAVSQSANLFAMIVVGGLGTVGGPILGALLLTLGPKYFLDGGDAAEILVATAMIVFLIALPDGIFGVFSRVLRRLRGEKQSVQATLMAGPYTQPDETAAARSHRRPLSIDIGAPPVLSAENLVVRFGDFTALDEASLVVRPGSIHAIVGPNGAGKTTLLNAVSGLQPIAEGAIKFEGAEVGAFDAAERRIRGIVRCFQHPTLVPDLNVLENVKLGLYPDRAQHIYRDFLGKFATRKHEEELAERAVWALGLVGIVPDRQGEDVRSLALSEQKRVEIARGIAGEGRLLLLDEPTAGLSGDEMASLRDNLVELQQELELPIVLISHHIGFVKRIAHDLTVLDYGRVVGHGAPEEVLARPEIAQTFAGIEPSESAPQGRDPHV